MSSTNAHHYRFDTVEVDPANRLLSHNGQDVHLTGRVFDILLIFVENPGRLLEKSELMEKVWHGDFVEEGNLTRNISTLRKALGDTARQHKYITTVQGHGYRFVADVTTAGDNLRRTVVSSSSPDPHARRPPISGHLATRLLLAALIAVLLIVTIWEAER